MAKPARKCPTWAPISAAYVAIAPLLSWSSWVILVDHWDESTQADVRCRGPLRSQSINWLKPCTTFVDSSDPCDAICVPIKIRAPAIRARPPSTVIAVAAPRGRPQELSRLATGDNIAASRIATASGTKTSER